MYIGHTIDFVKRKKAHKVSCTNSKNTNYNCKLYKIIRDNLGWDNWIMDVIAHHKCEDLMEAKKQQNPTALSPRQWDRASFYADEYKRVTDGSLFLRNENADLFGKLMGLSGIGSNIYLKNTPDL